MQYAHIEQLIPHIIGTLECSKQTFMHTIMLMQYKIHSKNKNIKTTYDVQ